MGFRTCQTSTATPAEPGGLPASLAIGFDPEGVRSPVFYAAGIPAANLLDFLEADDGGGPTVTPASYQGAFNQGYEAALKDLNRKKCGSFFGGQGPATIKATWYRFLDLHNPGVAAQTNSTNSVFINPNGAYMTYSPVPGQAGPFGLFWSQPQFRAFIILHELGHQLSDITGFQPDANNAALNQKQSQEVIGPCIK